MLNASSYDLVERNTKFGVFDDFRKPSRGPIGPILYGFVVPMGTTKPLSMGPIGPLQWELEHRYHPDTFWPFLYNTAVAPEHFKWDILMCFCLSVFRHFFSSFGHF